MATPVYLVTQEQATSVINRFKEAYPKLGSPRFAIYINRDLVDEDSGLKLSARKEKTDSIKSTVDKEVKLGSGTNVATITAPGQADRVVNQNTYRVHDKKEMTLADKQTIRDVERLFGRPLRLAGATLADQRAAAQLLEGKPVNGFSVETSSDQARRDREALSKIADVVIEVLISSRNVTVSEISGDRVYSVPDIQATAIRLNDSRIMGQASAAEIMGGNPAQAARSFSVNQIAEATALALMEDMLR
jgi:hypothetical protein